MERRKANSLLKEALLSILFISFSINSICQSNIQITDTLKTINKDTLFFKDAILVNTKTDKRISIDTAEMFFINYENELNDSTVEEVSGFGYFVHYCNDTIALKMLSLSKTLYENDVYISSSQNCKFDEPIFLNVALFELSYFNFSRSRENLGFHLFSGVYGLGLTNLLIGAPLESINYKNGTFDFSRYKKIILYSAIGVGAGITGALSFKQKTKSIELPYEEDLHMRRYWRIMAGVMDP